MENREELPERTASSHVSRMTGSTEPGAEPRYEIVQQQMSYGTLSEKAGERTRGREREKKKRERERERERGGREREKKRGRERKEREGERDGVGGRKSERAVETRLVDIEKKNKEV